MRRRQSYLVLALGGLLGLAACSGSTDETTTTEQAATTTTAAPVVEVRGVDFGFEGLPDVVSAGTTLTFVNESQVELHELVAIRLPNDETRSVADLVASPDLAKLFPRVTTVLIAPPSEGSVPVVGTGTLTEPGRYAIICAIPTGADPAEYMAAAAESEDGPPDVEGGPPHFVNGMFAELTVEG